MLADSFGKGSSLDIGAETLEFDIAAVLGRTVSMQSNFLHFTVMAQAGKLRCELSYRRCETSVEELLEMIRVEVRVARVVNSV